MHDLRLDVIAWRLALVRLDPSLPTCALVRFSSSADFIIVKDDVAACLDHNPNVHATAFVAFDASHNLMYFVSGSGKNVHRVDVAFSRAYLLKRIFALRANYLLPH